jgi:hypothetical protein
LSEQLFNVVLHLFRRTEYVVAPSTVGEKSEYQIQVCQSVEFKMLMEECAVVAKFEYVE